MNGTTFGFSLLRQFKGPSRVWKRSIERARALKVVLTNDKASLMIVEKNQSAALLNAHRSTRRCALTNSFQFGGLSCWDFT
jgi:hypothetical protein